jgi:hypothetical protein
LKSEFDFQITRRPEPPLPPAFQCAACERVIEPDRWHPDRHREPLCAYCERNWSKVPSLRPAGITRGDHRILMRLSAITNALAWEVINGKDRFQKRYITAC